MFDYLIKGGTVIDGSGDPRRAADIAVSDGSLVLLAPGSGHEAETVFDATGLCVAPGFIDPHTHYDAQLLWDPRATPSNLHGVTTVISGNCGFTIAPVRQPDRDATLADFAVTEGMSLDSLRAGVEWRWETFAEYLNALSGGLAINVGFLVGHSALRHFVMRGAAIERDADQAEVDAIVTALHAALDAGALGFSTSRGTGHHSHTGAPVASRWASDDEVIALCSAVGEHPGTSLELTLAGVLGRFSESEEQFLVDMSVAARRPLNWNMLFIEGATDDDRVRHQLRASVRAREARGRVTALTFPGDQTMTESLGPQSRVRVLPGFKDLVQLPIVQRIERLSDRAYRRELVAKAKAPGSPGADTFASLLEFDRYLVGDTFSPANAGLSGRMVGDIADEWSVDPFDAVAEIAIRDEMRTVFWPKPVSPPECWDLRARMWTDPDVLIGGSDAGAHLDRLCGASYPTEFLADMTRGRRLLSLEQAVHLLTAAPARFFGLHRKGVLADGRDADVVVFDPATVGAGIPYTARDLPGEGARLMADATGIRLVLVNGEPSLIEGAPTGARSGRVLRSGFDTVTTAMDG